jgi:hypothetical protein
MATVAAVLSYTVWRHLAEPDGGWFAYAPNTGVEFDGGGRGDSTDAAAFAAGGIWLGAIAIWASVALRIYRAPLDDPRRAGAPSDPPYQERTRDA